MSHSGATLRVLIVDDSAVARQILLQVLTEDRRISVTTSPDPVIALEKIAQERPDVIITDLAMPRMDGLSFVRAVMRQDPIPIIICSAATGENASHALQALHEGALELITKPEFGVRDFLSDSGRRLRQMVWELAASKLDQVKITAPVPDPKGNRLRAAFLSNSRPSSRPQPHSKISRTHLIAIGASTGGPEAIRVIVQAMPQDSPGIVIVQHMPAAFTRTFAEHLGRECAIEAKEAKDGDEVLPGRMLVAPGNRHLVLQGKGPHYRVATADGPPIGYHRPSIDVFFNSVAEVAGATATGILLTGMGKDGARGLLKMREAGSHTIAQDRESCIVFGMPGEAIALGAAAEVLPLTKIGPSLVKSA